MRRSHSIGQRIDWITVLMVGIMMILGWLNVASATSGASSVDWLDWGSKQGKQLIWLVICGILAMVILNIEGEFFIRTSVLHYIINVVLLLAVLVIGKKVGGARSWFGLGGISIQPSEFAKPATALLLAWLLSRGDGKLRSMKTLLQSIAVMGIPAALTLLQPDAGTTLVFGGLIFALYREGLSGNVLIAGFCALLVTIASILTGASVMSYPWIGSQSAIGLLWIILTAIGLVIWQLIPNMVVPRNRRRVKNTTWISLVAALLLSSGVHTGLEQLPRHQRERVQVLFGIDVSNPDADYNIRHAKAAIGSGGLSGKGFLSGPMTAYGFVPEQETDFIFCTVGEEWGFLGSAFVILLFTALLLRILALAERQRSDFTRIYAYGVVSILFMHYLINIAMVLGLAPVIGIPLPFFSAGGSSLMGFTLLVFILLRLDAERFSVLR
jgi:rod shape determining protein RodA